MIKESPRRRLGIFDVELAVVSPDLSMGARDNFALESEFVSV
jgi:hypothetical protein